MTEVLVRVDDWLTWRARRARMAAASARWQANLAARAPAQWDYDRYEAVRRAIVERARREARGTP